MGSSSRWEEARAKLERKRRPKLGDFLDALDAINPTPHDLEPAEREARYQAKSEVQTELIARFGPDLELRPDGDQWLLAVRGGRDAKHVVRHQLGESAQGWFSNELLRHHIAESDDRDEVAPGPPAARDDATPEADPLDAFLEVGDYEGAVAHLNPRADGGDARAGVQLLELLLDYLDEPSRAAEHVERWPSAVAAHPAVAASYALALARSGRAEAAEARAQLLDGPASARTWEELLRLALRDADHAAATRFADRLEAADPSRLHVVDAARTEVAAAVESALAPRVAEMEEAARTGLWDQAEAVAHDIVGREPGHRRAREILTVVEDRRRVQAAADAFAQGERLAAAGQPDDAARAFDRAAELGHPEGRARQQVEAGKREELERLRAIDAATRAAAEGDPLPWLDLDEAGRTQVRERVPAARALLDWLDACPSGRPRERVALARALVRAERHLDGDRPAEALDTLGRVTRTLERNRAAQGVHRRAQERERALRAAEASRCLALAEAADGPADEARARLDAVDTRWLDAEQRQRHRELEARLLARVSAAEQLRRFERLLASDPTAAWRLARREDGSGWTERAQRAEDRVQRFHRVHVLPEPVDAGDLEVPRSWSRPLATLDVEAGTVTLAEEAGHWISVAVVEIATSRVRRGLQLWMPSRAALRISPPADDGTTWLTGYSCAVQLDLAQGRVLDARHRDWDAESLSAVPTPRGTWWSGLHGAGWSFQSLEGRTTRVQGDYREMVATIGTDGAVAHRADGAVVYLLGDGSAYGIARIDMDALLSASVHPTERATVVVYIRGDEVVVASIGLDGEVRDVFRDRLHTQTELRSVTVAVSTARGRFFVLWPIDDVSFSLYVLDGEGRKVGGAVVGAPCSLVMDASAEHAALLYRSNRGLAVHRLDRDVVELSDPIPSLGYPRIDNFCEPPLDGPTEELAMYVEFDDGTLDAEVDRRVAEASGEAERLRITLALTSRFPRRGVALAARLGLLEHPLAAFMGASAMLEEDLSDEAAALLDGVDSERLPERWLEHYHHVRGVLALRRGDFDEAQAAFREGASCGAACGLVRWTEWTEILQRSAPDDADARGAAGIWQLVRRALVTARARLAEGDVAGAWRAVASGPISWLPFDDARMMRAHVVTRGAEIAPWTRRIALGRAADRLMIQAYLPEALTEAEADETSRRARAEGETAPE